ncbi:hypothetical protein CKAES1R_03847 [Pseudomonas aeruginosa]|nr:hypothetical protein CKAES1R_03847 [Pseudomonas aeruginosa]
MASSATSPRAARVFAGPATNCCWNRSWRAWSCAATGESSRRRVFRRFSRRCSRNTGCSTTNSASTMSTCRANTACRPATAITTCTTGWPSRKAWSTTSASTNTAHPGLQRPALRPGAYRRRPGTVQRPAGGRQPAAGASFFPLQRKCSYGSTDQRDYSFKRPTYDQEHHLAGEALEHQDSSYERYDYPVATSRAARPAFQRKPPQRTSARCTGGIGQRRRPRLIPATPLPWKVIRVPTSTPGGGRCGWSIAAPSMPARRKSPPTPLWG